MFTTPHCSYSQMTSLSSNLCRKLRMRAVVLERETCTTCRAGGPGGGGRTRTRTRPGEHWYRITLFIKDKMTNKKKNRSRIH